MFHYVYKTIHTPTGRWYVGIKQSIRESNRSRVVSDETRERISAAQRARSPKRGSNGRFE